VIVQVTQRELQAGIQPVFRAPPPLKGGKGPSYSSPQHGDKAQSRGGHLMGLAGHLAPSHTAPPAKALYKTHLKKTSRYQVRIDLCLAWAARRFLGARSKNINSIRFDSIRDFSDNLGDGEVRCGSDSNVHQRRKTIALEFKKDSCSTLNPKP
jgi:hypothetical protein